MRNINKIIIHCSASPNGRPDTVEDIHRWHQERGFDCIGYHWVVEVDGDVKAGRPEWMVGAHARGYNSNSIGICMVGTDEFSDEQWHWTADLLEELKLRYPRADIIGHNQVSNKKCPGFDVQVELKSRLKIS